jgi:uncharacterized protein (TIGR04255 family)
MDMTPETRAYGRFEPLHDAHAIDQALFSVQFAQTLNDGSFQEVLNAANPLSKDLPGIQDVPGFPMPFGGFPIPMFPVPGVQVVAAQMGNPFGAISGPVVSSPVAPGARMMRNIRRDGSMENELKLERNSISFRTSSYEGWDITWGKVNNYFRDLLPIYAKTATLASVGLIFLDKFVWMGPPEECVPSMLLRADSIYVSPYVYDITDLWHNHTGRFIRASNLIKRLLNVNVDNIDESTSPPNQRRVVGITTVVTDLMNQPTYDQLLLSADSIADFCVGEMNDLHLLSKEVFGNVINDAMCHRIGLTA